ncbi:Type 1 glutamine amidotransferase-like domain-containing protein [Oceanirhabdus seepicola]|uniref:Type 1 glutamine amidotransferase-like domain-containing protein n=1 Tax=Oceanirhabdus seepicola TaxID=2828781 RepID=A0A9J6NY98_9CLOT|nr:Type 1 glutamine amidotransferase-like domain-containing protein [Oceanirhabdus seepicola]MCM1989243.1 Type 1 glutamine amidotransferase-like domain-containing protein [Oceanirhabdus seepicola]
MPKLILYSDQIIGKTKKVDNELLNLLEKNNPSIGYIPSCSDFTRKYFNQRIEYYKALGIHDLQYFDIDKEYEETRIMDIFKCDAIHLSGGNTFYFLHLLKKRGFIELLKSYVNNGGILIGISAGSIIMTKTIDLAGYGEDSDENIIGLEITDSLGFVDFEFYPHWDGSENILDSLNTYAKKKDCAVYACKDGDGIVINDDEIKLIGDISRIG